LSEAVPTRLTGREFEAIADHAGAAYLRYSFTKGTEQEVRFLVGALGLGPGDRVLDVGCGPGRHSNALRRIGIESVGVDISSSFLAAAGEGWWVRADARRLPFVRGSFDVAISLCQGGFGLLGGREEGVVLAEMARTVRSGGKLAVSGFSAYFAVRHLEDGETFDADTGVNHEIATVKDPAGRDRRFGLWTTCFTPREMRLMAAAARVEVTGLWSVSPGDYACRPPDLEHPELLLVGEVVD
jgi:SAM-dependent methyltransferase